MFKALEQYESGTGGPASGVAALPRALLLDAQVDQSEDEPSTWRERLAQIDWMPDLAEQIGSRTWCRGLGTLGGLILAALAFWPGFAPLQARLPDDPGVRDEYRSEMITPIAFGAESGRRMGPTAAVRPLAFAPERTQLSFVAALGEGDSFPAMLQRAGVGAADAGAVTSLVAQAMPLQSLEPGTRFAIVMGQRPAPGQPRRLDKLDFRARFDLALSIDAQGGGFRLEKHPIAVDTRPLRVQGVVGSSLYQSARAAGAPIEAIQQYLQAIGNNLGADAEIVPGDRFDMILSHKRSQSGESETGELLFAGLARDGMTEAELLRWGSSGQFVSAASLSEPQQQFGGGGMMWPVHGHITSGYGWRMHPILGYARLHAGVDFGAPYGSPIVAVSDGVVSFAGWHGGHGNFVRLEHGGGLGTGYGHMSRIAVSPGEHVHVGQVIGYVGSTGLSTGPHLHYEVYRNGQTVNPLGVNFNFSVQPRVDSGQLASFKAQLERLKAIPPLGGSGRVAQAEIRPLG